MGPEERIIAEEDRLFLTSLGNWAGDAVFYPIAPPINVALFTFAPNGSGKETLSYPAVLIEPNGGGTFKMFFSTGGPIGPPNSLTLTLTVGDGNYSFVGVFEGPPYTWAWPVEFYFDTPPDWNRNNAYVEIRIDVICPNVSNVWFFHPSLVEEWYPPPPPKKPQYLPLVGIG